MASSVSMTALADSTSDSAIRSWAQYVEDTLLITGGWQLTNDTGQTAPSSLTAATANSQKKGYRLYTMADSLQADYPVSLRIDYGSGVILGSGNTSPPYSPGLWLTIGTGSDGSGNITGRMLSSHQVCAFFGGGGAIKSYASAGPGRITMGLWASGSGSNPYWATVFGIERWKTAAGADTGGGLLVVSSAARNVQGNVAQVLIYSPCLAFGAASQQPIDSGLNYVHTTSNPSSTAFGNRGVGVLFHFRGTAVQPGTNFLICNSTDIPDENYLFVNIYGVKHTYLSLGGGIIPWIGAIAPVGFGPQELGDIYRTILMRFD